jgi:hypothetical protein
MLTNYIPILLLLSFTTCFNSNDASNFNMASTNGFTLKDFVATVLNDVIFLNRTSAPLETDCKANLELWLDNLVSSNPEYWSVLGIEIKVFLNYTQTL